MIPPNFDQNKFESLIQQTANCWFWLGKIDNNYNIAKYKGVSAIKLSWELFNNEEVEEKFIVKNTCCNGLCVNPHHAEIVRLTFPWRA